MSRVTVGHCVLAHVRAASPGLPVTETNCHPFTAGTLSFMHNGAVSGFRCLKRALIGQLTDDAFNAIEGTTDSEYVFALFRSLLQTRGAAEKEHVSVDDMARALGQAIRIVSEIVSEAGIEDETRLNLVASDGRQAVISRYARKPEIAESLYVCQDRQYVVEEGRSRLVHPAPGEESVIVSSERLSEDEGWSPVPLNHMVLIDPDLNVRIEALDL